MKSQDKVCMCECLITLRSQMIKICADCGKTHPWPLDDGQKPLITSSRDIRKDGDITKQY